MHAVRFRGVIVSLLLIWAGQALAQATTGRISGRILRDDKGMGGVTIVILETHEVAISDSRGRFSFNQISGGTYTLTFTLGDQSTAREGVKVDPGLTTELDVEVDWDPGVLESLTVYSASKRLEKLVEAPAAITIVPTETIENEAGTGQVPKLLEFTPGAEVTQSGLYDYNFNTRGFNSSLNRRVAVYVDGRDISAALLGAQEWSAALPIDDVANMEFVRGPSAALYGKNASSGVINLTSKSPRDYQGGLLRVTLGQLSTTNLDVRWATDLGKGWYAKVVGAFRESDDFALSRTQAVEYTVPCAVIGEDDCLPIEAIPLQRTTNDIRSGSMRFDKYLDDDSVLTFEAGSTDIEGPVFLTGIGRIQTNEAQRPFFRFNYADPHWNAVAYYARRKGDQASLQSGNPIDTGEDRYAGEVQTNWDLAGGKGRVIGGAFLSYENIESEALFRESIDAHFSSLMGQLDWRFNNHWKVVGAVRFDESNLYDDVQISPKAAVVYSVNPSHSVRFTYNHAFQVANYSEFYLQNPVAPPADLSLLENLICAPAGIDCGLGLAPVLALGNESLQPETTDAFEIGYSGIISRKLYLTVDYYVSKNEDFITDLLRQCQPGVPASTRKCGSPPPEHLTNPQFGPWVGPPDAENTILFGNITVAQAVRNAFAITNGNASGVLLSNDLDGSNIVAALSYRNFGEVDTQGVDVGLNYFIDRHWKLQFAYSWFDFEPGDLPGLTPGEQAQAKSQLLPNTPENKISFGAGFTGKRGAISVNYRWNEDFRWSAGLFEGNVSVVCNAGSATQCQTDKSAWTSTPYDLIDLNASYALTPEWKVGVNVANLMDSKRAQAFGGDLISRRALVNVLYEW